MSSRGDLRESVALNDASAPEGWLRLDDQNKE